MEMLDTLVNILSIVILQSLFAWWIQARITNSIKHEYDKKLEEYKNAVLKKERSAVIAEFLAEWTHLKDNDTKRLNQLLWELTMYLPSNLVRDLNSLIGDNSSKISSNQIIKSVRDYLLNNSDPISATEVTYFHHQSNSSMKSFTKKQP